MEFKENFTSLRDLEEGDIYISKMDMIGQYIKDLGDDKHRLKSLDEVNYGSEYEVPHGKFPVFKQL